MMLKLILSKIRYISFCFCFYISVCYGISEPLVYQHGVAMHGDLKYGPSFQSFNYVETNAPRNGVLKQASFGSFDTFNPFSINGIAPSGIGLTHDTLMKSSADEAFSLYGLIADGISILPDNQGVAFHINPKARFNDNTPILAKDVAFSFNILKQKGIPTYRYYYQDVDRVEIRDDYQVVFYFKLNTNNRELPFILGELPVLSEKEWKNRDFEKTSLDIPVSSGPYLIESYEAGRSISYKRNPNYWASDLNVNKGFYHFEKISYDYYRDTTVAMEAFKSGAFDVRQENEAKKWAQFQEDDLIKNGQIKTAVFHHQMPSGMQGFVFNLRRPIFQNILVRKALSNVFDFEWMNRNLFYGLYNQTTSFFDNSYLKAPQTISEAEKKLWQSLNVTELFSLPIISDDKTRMREKLKQSLEMLIQAGWRVEQGILVDKNGYPFVFEILLNASSSSTWERVVLPFIGQLKRLGIQVKVRSVDTIQYKNRLDTFDYDMIVSVWGQSLSPGNEQRYFWGTQAADSEGSMNYSGIKSNVVDLLIDKVTTAQTKEDLTTAVQALDRFLLSQHIVIPHWYSSELRFFMQPNVQYPKQVPMKGPDITTWWKE